MQQLSGIVAWVFWMRLSGITAASSKWKPTYELPTGLPVLLERRLSENASCILVFVVGVHHVGFHFD